MAGFDPKIVSLADGRKAVIRSAREDDAAALLETNKLSMLDGAGMILTADEYTLTEDEVKAFIKVHADGPKDLMLLADADDVVAGNLGFRIAKPRRCAHWAPLQWPCDRDGAV